MCAHTGTSVFHLDRRLDAFSPHVISVTYVRTDYVDSQESMMSVVWFGLVWFCYSLAVFEDHHGNNSSLHDVECLTHLLRFSIQTALHYY